MSIMLKNIQYIVCFHCPPSLDSMIHFDRKSLFMTTGSDAKALDFPNANMPLYSDVSGTETGKCLDCTKVQQTVALFETRLSALEKRDGRTETEQDPVAMEASRA